MIPPFFIVPCHTKPTDAVNELNHLDDVFNEAKIAFSTDLGMIMGDLNADCSYLSNTKYNLLDLIIDTDYTWWINKLADTTTSNSNCAYDRLVIMVYNTYCLLIVSLINFFSFLYRIITQSSLNPFVVKDSVEIFLFDNLLGLSIEQVNKNTFVYC